MSAQEKAAISELALRLIRENKEKHAGGEDASLLDLGNCGLTEVPREIGKLAWLEILSFSPERFEWDGQQLNLEQTQNTGPANNIARLPASISRLQSLKQIWLYGSYHEKSGLDLAPLAGLTSLQMLGVFRTRVTDLTPLAGLTSLQLLVVSETPVTDLTPLAGIASLQRV